MSVGVWSGAPADGPRVQCTSAGVLGLKLYFSIIHRNLDRTLTSHLRQFGLRPPAWGGAQGTHTPSLRPFPCPRWRRRGAMTGLSQAPPMLKDADSAAQHCFPSAFRVCWEVQRLTLKLRGSSVLYDFHECWALCFYPH